ncbi:MAG TPA: alkaline phosphatase family protein [Clostridia bacterium]|nr:alkaline phosphatase family protein [Clostridia bacterium]
MKNKVILILVDGMRPDGLLECENPYVPHLLESSCTFMDSQTIMPSVTLPCHMSLFHSVPADRHGILTNTWVPQVRPVKGIFDVLAQNNKKSASFYNWEELRDLGKPGTLTKSLYLALGDHENSDNILTDEAIKLAEESEPDFIFLYLGETDEIGHKHGWMGKEYKDTVNNAVSCIERVIDATKGAYTFIITADHGGHDRSHGSDMPEDMTIPIIIHGKGIPENIAGSPTILDIAPTVTHILGIAPDRDWEGISILGR